MSAQILIVDDSAYMRNSIRACIEENTNWEVCGEAENGEIAVEKVKTLNPDLVILDLAMPVMNGLEAARRISDFAPEVTMVLFTMHESAMVWKAARAVGIQDVLSKSEDGNQQLLDSLRGLLDKSGIH